MSTKYELQINNKVIGEFKTLKAARAYYPDMSTALDLGIDLIDGTFTRFIKVIKGKRASKYAHNDFCKTS